MFLETARFITPIVQDLSICHRKRWSFYFGKSRANGWYDRFNVFLRFLCDGCLLFFSGDGLSDHG